MNSNTILLALAFFSSASALTMKASFSVPSFSFPKAKASKAAPRAVPENELPLSERLNGVGITEPFAEGFDPLGLAKRADAGEMNKYREAELKHGRVAMLAVPGFLLAERFHPFFPNLPGDEESIYASQDTWETVRDRPLLVAFLLGVAAFESLSFKNYEEPTSLSPWRAPEQNSGGRSGAMRADIVPGATFPRGPWTADKLSPEEFLAKQNAELNNGRLAMISMVALVAQEFFTGLPVEDLDIDAFGGSL